MYFYFRYFNLHLQAVNMLFHLLVKDVFLRNVHVSFYFKPKHARVTVSYVIYLYTVNFFNLYIHSGKDRKLWYL